MPLMGKNSPTIGGSESPKALYQSSLLSFVKPRSNRNDEKISSSAPSSPLVGITESKLRTNSLLDELDSDHASIVSNSLENVFINSSAEDSQLPKRFKIGIENEDNERNSNFSAVHTSKISFKNQAQATNFESLPSLNRQACIYLKPSKQHEETLEVDEQRYAWLVDVRDAKGKRPGECGYDPRSLYIPKSAWEKFTPFERQFWEFKSERLFDTVVFFKKGKFFELYEGDADIGAREFDLKMTERINMRMVGIPEASFEYWAGKFVSHGYKVARVDQMETAIGKELREQEKKTSVTKKEKVVQRKLSCILTAGTLVDPSMLTSDQSTICVSIKEECILEENVSFSFKYGLACVDASTAKFSLVHLNGQDELVSYIIKLNPHEIVIEQCSENTSGMSETTLGLVKNLCPNAVFNFLKSKSEFLDARHTVLLIHQLCEKYEQFSEYASCLKDSPECIQSAFGALYWYLDQLQLASSLIPQAQIEITKNDTRIKDASFEVDYMTLDGETLVALDIFTNNGLLLSPSNATIHHEKVGTLLSILDFCLTPFGRRLLKEWISKPLYNIEEITDRQDVIEFFMSKGGHIMEGIASSLKGLPDIERLLCRANAGNLRVHDFIVIINSLSRAEKVLRDLRCAIEKEKNDSVPHLLKQLLKSIPNVNETLDFFAKAFDHEKAKSEGTIIPARGVHVHYDSLLDRKASLHALMDQYLQEQASSLKINSKHVRYRDIGKDIFQLEIPMNEVQPSLSSGWILMSKTKGVNRYWTPWIRERVKEWQILEELLSACQRNIYSDILCEFSKHSAIFWRPFVTILSQLDCLMSLTRCSLNLEEPKCRPIFLDSKNSPILSFTDLRHSAFSSCLSPNRPFIPNDIELGTAFQPSTVIFLTGPNMGGKSTLLRQTCLAVIMAQLGCWVTASSARLTAVDRIFTRMGSSDNILAGRSTFLVEVSETVRIIREATPRSLVILDELGRGTATWDGIAIAQAVLNWLVKDIGCMGFFATHYGHSMLGCGMENLVSCRYMSCILSNDASWMNITESKTTNEYQKDNGLIFTYKLVPGISPRSFGVNVAKMANLPDDIIYEAAKVAEDHAQNTCQQSAQTEYAYENVWDLIRLIPKRLKIS